MDVHAPHQNRPAPDEPARLLYQVLDHVQEGIFIVDPTGRLVFVNAAWANWTGYTTEELCNRHPPFPFWVSHTPLATLGGSAPSFPSQNSGTRTAPAASVSGDAFPFRHRNHSLFWCQMETATAEIAGQTMTIAFLRRVPAAARGPRARPRGRIVVPPGPAQGSNPQRARRLAEKPSPLSFAAEAPRWTEGIALLLRPGGLIDLWDERWEELTGITGREVAGTGTELLLDWLFPRQPDRSFVADLFHQPGRRGAQARLEIAGRTGNRSLHFTFLPVRALNVRAGLPTTRVYAQAPVGDAWLNVARPCEMTVGGKSRG
jgi:PAS domain-containing protein